MYFAIYSIDKTGHAELRAKTRPAHLEYLNGFNEAIHTSGPLLDDEGTGMIGSLLIVDFPDRKAAEAFAAGDPYAKAGLFASTRVTRWRKARPAS